MRNRIVAMRTLGVLTTAVAAGALVVGCSPTGQNETIRILSPSNDVWGSAFEHAIEAYKAVNPDVTIELDSTPYEGYADVMQTQLVGGAAADILFVEPPVAATLVDRGFVADLSDELSVGSA